MGVVSLRQSSVVVVHVVVVARDYIVRRPQRIDMRRGAWLHHRQVCHLYAIDHSYILSLLSHPGRGGIGQSDRSALAFGEEHSLITATSVSFIPLRSRWHWSVRPQRIGFRRGAQLDHSQFCRFYPAQVVVALVSQTAAYWLSARSTARSQFHHSQSVICTPPR
jgi:hypothetical protein